MSRAKEWRPALVMAKVSADVRYCLASEPEVNLAVNEINACFCRAGWEDRFATFVILVLDPRHNEVTVVNAGHMPPLFAQASGEVIELSPDEAGLPLGVMEGHEFTATKKKLLPGEFVCLFTDGISEAMNPARDLYGLERLQKQVGVSVESIPDLGRSILADVKTFVNGYKQSDDMCLVCFGREGS